MFSSKTDGQDHINIYSKGKTNLGRFLSNFTYWPIDTEDGSFKSIEGYWYWLGCTHPDKDTLRNFWGFKAKMKGRELGATDWLEEDEFKDKIRRAIKIKIDTMPDSLKQAFKSSKLPFTHYYEYGGKVVNVLKAQWIVDYIDSLREVG